MQASPMYDVGAALVTVGIGLIISTLLISVIEAGVLFLLKWDKFGRCLLVSLLTNVISTVFGIGSAMVGSFGFFASTSIWVAVIAAFVLSVLIEVVVLMMLKRGDTRLNWLASLAANSASYLLIILPLAWRIAW
jgi:hypothetical protein